MLKSDVQLQRDVIDELRWDPRIGPNEIGVAARDGVVTLSGYVDSTARRHAAIKAAERVAGVKALAEDLIVKVPTSFARTDTDIAHAARNALKWNVEVPVDAVKVRVDDGWLLLEGQVDWQYQRTAVLNCVRSLVGVRGVTNNVTLKPHSFASDVRDRIENALKRSAEVDSKKISVQMLDGKVILRGTVRSWAERQDAEQAAWSAPGVTAVEDQIAIRIPVTAA
ncbi:MAG: BON domain-containing protein [Gemmatimonadota bacterium]